MKKQYHFWPILLTILLSASFSVYATTPGVVKTTYTEVLPLEISITPDTAICAGDSLILKVNAFNAAGSVSFLWNQNLKEGNIQQISPQASTLYTVEAKDEQGNTATASVQVTVFEKPKPMISGEQNICQGVTAHLDAGEFAAYQWNTGSKTRTIDVTDDGEISVKVQDENGCWGEANTIIKEREFKYPRITGELGFCLGLTTKLDAGEFAAYQWSTGEKTRTIEVGDDGLYSVTVQDEHGCISHAKKEVIEYEVATPVIRGDTFFCPGSTTRLNARGHFDFYAWSTGETAPAIEVGEEGVYRVNVESEDGCLGENSIKITQLVAPKPEISGPSSFCAGEPALLDVGPFSGYLWTTGDTTETIHVSEPGTYSVTVTDEQGCTGTTNVQIEMAIPLLQSVDAGIDQKIQPGEMVKLSASRATKYLWRPAASLSCTDCRNPKATPLQTTTYHLTAWDKNGCSMQDSVTITVLKK